MLNNGCCRLSVYGDRRFTFSWDDVFINGPTDMRISNVIARRYGPTSALPVHMASPCWIVKNERVPKHEVMRFIIDIRGRPQRTAYMKNDIKIWSWWWSLLLPEESSLCVCVCASRCVPQRGTLPRCDQCKWARLHAHVRVSVWGGGKLISQCFC